MPPQVRAGEPGAAARVESGGEGAAWPTAREGVDRSASHRRHGVLELCELAYRCRRSGLLLPRAAEVHADAGVCSRSKESAKSSKSA